MIRPERERLGEICVAPLENVLGYQFIEETHWGLHNLGKLLERMAKDSVLVTVMQDAKNVHPCAARSPPATSQIFVTAPVCWVELEARYCWHFSVRFGMEFDRVIALVQANDGRARRHFIALADEFDDDSDEFAEQVIPLLNQLTA